MIKDLRKHPAVLALVPVITYAVSYLYLAWYHRTPFLLEHGVGDLTQRPDFARDGGLSVPYLLASHFFEHFLDSLFFAALCVLIGVGSTRSVASGHGFVAFDHGRDGPKDRCENGGALHRDSEENRPSSQQIVVFSDLQAPVRAVQLPQPMPAE